MSYEKIEFQPYDTLTAEQLNQMQDALVSSRVETGVYTGTGTTGVIKTFSLQPKAMFLWQYSSTGSNATGETYMIGESTARNGEYWHPVTSPYFSGNSLKTDSATYGNGSSKTYHYIVWF